jgi:hypothetical protein
MFQTTLRRLGLMVAAIVVLSWLLGFLLVGGCATVKAGACAAGGSLVNAAEERHASPIALVLARVAMAVLCPPPSAATSGAPVAPVGAP